MACIQRTAPMLENLLRTSQANGWSRALCSAASHAIIATTSTVQDDRVLRASQRSKGASQEEVDGLKESAGLGKLRQQLAAGPNFSDFLLGKDLPATTPNVPGCSGGSHHLDMDKSEQNNAYSIAPVSADGLLGINALVRSLTVAFCDCLSVCLVVPMSRFIGKRSAASQSG
jgi:hypothetical protein